MPLPHDPQRAGRPFDFLAWRTSTERIIERLQGRVAAIGTRDVGLAFTWLGPTSPLPPGLLLLNGSTVAIADHPQLYDQLGTTYNTGGEPAGTFRLPTMPAPSVGVAVVRG